MNEVFGARAPLSTVLLIIILIHYQVTDQQLVGVNKPLSL